MLERRRALDRARESLPELMLAQLTAVVANTGFRSFARPKSAVDYMPSQREAELKRVSTPATEDDRRQAVENLRQQFSILLG